MPMVLEYLDKVEMVGIEEGVYKSINNDFLQSKFIIKNYGSNTAKNVEIELRFFKGDNVSFVPNVFHQKKESNRTNSPINNVVFTCDNLVPGEKVYVFINSKYSTFKEWYKIDTLIYDKPVDKTKFYYGPTMTRIKHSNGKVNIIRKDSLVLKEFK